MTYCLAPDICFALLDRRAVILDVSADRYRLLDGRLASAFVALSLDARTADRPALDALVRAGILVPGHEPIGSRRYPTMKRSALDAALPSGRARGIAQLFVTLIAMIVRLRLLGLKSTLAHAHRLKMHSDRLVDDEQRAVALARSVAALRPRIPIARICLRDSLTLFALLLEAGLDAQLVFGVRLDPFVAHSWVQSGSTLLSDDLETVAEFTPILVL